LAIRARTRRLARPAGADPATASYPAAGLPRQRLTPATQSRQHVLELGKLDLRLALAAARMLGEDIQNQRGAIDDLYLHDVLELAQLTRAQLAIANHRVRASRSDDFGQFRGLASADVCCRVGPLAPLNETLENLRSGRLREP
jgi:hypothetical protein